MDSITKTLHNISETIKEKFDELTATEPTFSRADIIALEEAERTRRVDQAAASRISELNAAKASALIKSASFPYFKGNTSRGYKRFTSSIEENERKRRLTARAESTLRKGNAQKASGFIKSLGWPFNASTLSHGPTYIFPDVTEEERAYRLSDQWTQLQAKNNAALIANLIRMEYSRNSSAFGTKRWTRNLEEKERARRLRNREELSNSARNAYNLSKLIRNLGWPFFIQETEKAADPTIALEEKERARRLADREEQQLARENAGKIFSTLQFNDIGSVEEREKSRRLADFGEQQHAKSLARLVSGLVSQDFANKSSASLPLSSLRAYSLKKTDGLVLSLRSIKYLEEQERKRRMNDIDGQAFARQNAKQVSSLFGSNFGAKSINSLEEEERTRRMWDRQLQMVALSNARKVSKLILSERRSSISTRKATTAALEEKERNRRMIDRSYQQLARSHNKKVSDLFAASRGFPAAEVSIPIEPLAQTRSYVLPMQTSLAAAPVLPVYAHTQTAPLYSTSAPSAPVQSSPMTYLPSGYTTVQPTTAPITTLPASGLQLHAMSDNERKKLERQAISHNKKAEKESRKATKDLAKAEKLHNKGKDSKAFKHETRAEQHTVAAKHHQLWAQDLAKDAAPTYAQQQQQAYRPAM